MEPDLILDLEKTQPLILSIDQPKIQQIGAIKENSYQQVDAIVSNLIYK
jgi:hypothetical protein